MYSIAWSQVTRFVTKLVTRLRNYSVKIPPHHIDGRGKCMRTRFVLSDECPLWMAATMDTDQRAWGSPPHWWARKCMRTSDNDQSLLMEDLLSKFTLYYFGAINNKNASTRWKIIKEKSRSNLVGNVAEMQYFQGFAGFWRRANLRVFVSWKNGRMADRHGWSIRELE